MRHISDALRRVIERAEAARTRARVEEHVTAEVKGAVARVLAECHTDEARAAEVAEAIVQGEIPHVKVTT